MNSQDSLLITGAFGFVGLSYLDWLIEQPIESIPKKIGLVSQRERLIDPRFEKFGIQITNIKADLTQQWEFEFEPSHLLNLAADGSENAYTVEAGLEYLSINRNMIEWLESKSVDTLFHASSGACNYGTNNSLLGNFTELDSRLVDFVNQRKQVETDIREYAKVKNLIISRLFTFTGKHLLNKNQYVVVNFIKSAIYNGEIVIHGNPDTIRSYLSGSDLAEWINRSLSCHEKNQEFIQIGSDTPVTLLELAEFISTLTGCAITIEPNIRKREIYLPNVTATRNLLGVSENIDWKSQIQGLLDLLIKSNSI